MFGFKRKEINIKEKYFSIVDAMYGIHPLLNNTNSYNQLTTNELYKLLDELEIKIADLPNEERLVFYNYKIQKKENYWQTISDIFHQYVDESYKVEKPHNSQTINILEDLTAKEKEQIYKHINDKLFSLLPYSYWHQCQDYEEIHRAIYQEKRNKTEKLERDKMDKLMAKIIFECLGIEVPKEEVRDYFFNYRGKHLGEIGKRFLLEVFN